MPLRQGLPILAYHSLSDDPGDPLAIPPARFQAHMAWLHAAGVQVLALDEGLRRLRGGQAVDGCLVLTFDDGYADFAVQAAPVLDRYGFPATVFVVVGKLGQTSDWGRRPRHRPLLSLSDLKALYGAGYAVGSHSVSHPRLPTLPPTGLDAEVRTARAVLEHELGCASVAFAYPYGQFGWREREAVRRAGYVAACGSRGWWGNTPATHPFALERFEMWQGYSLRDFQLIVAAWLKWPLVARPLKRRLLRLPRA